MSVKVRLLIAEDDACFREVLVEHLELRGFDVLETSNIEAARKIAQSQRPDVIVLDQRLPDGDGVILAQELLSIGLVTKIILVTAHAELARAVAATRAGVFDYLEKPIELPILEATIRRAAKAASVERRWVQPDRRNSGSTPPLLVGTSQPLVRLRAQLEAAGRACPAPVLVTGETGTGKSLAARLIHSHSPRARGPLVVVNSAAIPDSMFEAEVFGHERGAFTGASESRAGLFEAAHGGTLVLDEVGEVPLAVQAKLLRAIEEGVVRRIGASAERPIDVRLVATTNRDVERLVASGDFRNDLYYRIAVLRIELPPLRDRRQDLPLLVRNLLSDLGADPDLGPPERLVAQLALHGWPGNVRELRNVLQRWLAAAGSSEGGSVEAFMYPRMSSNVEATPAMQHGTAPQRLRDATVALERSAVATFPTLADAEAEHIRQALARSNHNRTKAAHLLGISRATLRRKLREKVEA
jgi:DNA-binding NtrC family response regulator